MRLEPLDREFPLLSGEFTGKSLAPNHPVPGSHPAAAPFAPRAKSIPPMYRADNSPTSSTADR